MEKFRFSRATPVNARPERFSFRERQRMLFILSINHANVKGPLFLLYYLLRNLTASVCAADFEFHRSRLLFIFTFACTPAYILQLETFYLIVVFISFAPLCMEKLFIYNTCRCSKCMYDFDIQIAHFQNVCSYKTLKGRRELRGQIVWLLLLRQSN